MAELSAFEKAQSLKILGCYNTNIEKSIEKQDLEKGGVGSGKHAVGASVKVPNNLTTDPAKRQGQSGTVTESHEHHAVVSFADGGTGSYDHDALMKKSDTEDDGDAGDNMSDDDAQ